MSFLDIVKALLPLVVIVGLLYGVLLFIKKYGISFKGNKSGSVSINVLSSQMIMPKKFISVVRVEDKLLVLGVSDNSITLLKELEYTGELENPYSPEESKKSFVELLKKNLGIR
ncbi:MAG: flagellar biosynthetic protein FliO [Bacteroidetes bacterium]|nr:flagellar biosynthetic protein FliO [Bacteroidota bacterium]